MGASRKTKIKTHGGSELGQNPFGGLEKEGLPKGEGEGTRPESRELPFKHRAKKSSLPKNKGRVEIRREKAGRGGKTVTTLQAFPTHTPLAELERLLQHLKKQCACGGSLKGRVIELQGDVRLPVAEYLQKQGFQAVQAGG